jgi:pyruvate formate lyase activating enzyme
MAKIFDIKHFSVHDGPGIRTTVFFKGCPLKCIWCHNPESILSKTQLAFSSEKCTLCGACVAECPSGVHILEDGRHILQGENCTFCRACENICPVGALTVYGKEVPLDEVLREALEDRDFYGASGGVTLSGGECLLQANFCADLLSALKAEGIHTAVDTCGYVPRETLDKVAPFTDIFLYDLKAFDEDVHIRLTGRSNDIILDNLRYLETLGKKVEIRIPYVPRANSDQMDKIAHFIASLHNITAVRVLAYHNFALSKYDALGMANTSPEGIPTNEEMRLVRARMHELTGLPVPD